MNISISRKKIGLPWFPGGHFLRGLKKHRFCPYLIVLTTDFFPVWNPHRSLYKIWIYQIKTLAHRPAAQSRCLRNDERTVLLPVLEAELRDSGSGLRFTDFRWVAFSCKQRFQFIWISPDKVTKQSRDLSVCLCYSLLNINNILKQKGCFVCREAWTRSQCLRKDVLRVY